VNEGVKRAGFSDVENSLRWSCEEFARTTP
jgi:hypothetical protein